MYIKLVSTLITVCFLLIACGGDSSDTASGAAGSDTAPLMDNPTIDPGSSSAGIASLPASPDQPNTVSPDILQDASGQYHAVYTDIDGRGFYAICSSACQMSTSWSSTEILDVDYDSSSGSLTPKLRMDNIQRLHVAFAFNDGSQGIFSKQTFYYGNCDTECLEIDNWIIGQAFDHGAALLQQESQVNDWFAITPSGDPRIAAVGPTGFFEDEYLLYYSCNSGCTDSRNWNMQIAAELGLASSTSAHLEIDDFGSPHVLARYWVIGASESRLLYFSCLSACNSAEPQWSSRVDLLTLQEDPFSPNASSFSLRDDGSRVLAVFQNDDSPDVLLFTCDSQCNTADRWSVTSLLADLPIPQSISVLSPHLTLNTDDGAIEIAMIGKDRNANVANRVFKVRCTVNCENGAWSFQNLADTSPVQFSDVGICLFIGTGATGPLRITGNAVSFGLYPHWACSGPAVEVFDPEIGTYIDNNADIRFFEIAAFASGG